LEDSAAFLKEKSEIWTPPAPEKKEVEVIVVAPTGKPSRKRIFRGGGFKPRCGAHIRS